MRRLSIALVAGLVAAAPAHAEDFDWWWVSAGSGSSGANTQVYVDHNSIKTIKDHSVQAWTFFIQDKPFPDGEAMALVLYTINCAKRTMTYTARTSLDQQGKELRSARFDGLPVDPIKPDTNADVLRRHLCRDHPLPSVAVANPVQHAMRMWGRAAPAAATAAAEKEEPTAGYGTGFFVSATGDIVTSYHVIDGATTITVYTEDRKEHPARIIRSSPATDLVVLHIDYKAVHHLTLAPANSAKSGDRVFTFGFPVVEMLGAEPKYTDGAISSLSGIGGEAAFAQISVPVQPGNSGGPLVNEQGTVVGVIAAQAAVKDFTDATGTLPQNVNWAVRSEYIAPLIGSQPVTRSLSRDEAVALARQSVVIVFAEGEDSSDKE